MDHEGSQNPEEGADSPQQKERLKHRVLKPGESYGNYRVVRCISAGLIANYYHMQHVRDLHDVTVGVFHPRSLKDPKFVKRLQALQKATDGCQHEGIPKIRDIDEINERHCIFLDMVKGQSLSNYFVANGQPGQSGVGVGNATRILAQLLGLLGYAHSMKLDHRDLDSDLIFVQEDGSLRVLGLGVKAAAGVELFESIVSASVSPLVSNKTAGRLNSFDVMSAEYRGGVGEDARVDVYEAGVIGYWLLTGRKPERERIHPPSVQIEGLSPQWDVFFAKCLESDRDERYASCKVALVGLKETEQEPESERAGFIQRQIDRIPVPQSILARGELAARVYRLSVIGVIGLTLTAITASFLKLSFEETEEYDRVVATVAGPGEKAQLLLKLQPKVARVAFERYRDDFVSGDGTLALKVQPGDYRLRVSAPRHIDRFVEVSVRPSETQEFSIELKPAWTDFRIVSEPGATVSVIDERNLEIELGLTDGEGDFFLKKGIFAGVYRIVVRKEGYEPGIVDNQTLQFGEMTQLEVPLTPLPSSLTVRTDPPGARVTVNEREVGRTPLTLESVEPSEHSVVAVHREGFRSVGRRVTIEAGEDELVDFGRLTPLSGEIVFEVSFKGVEASEEEGLLRELRAEIDGETRRLEGTRLDSVPAGARELRLVHPLFQSPLREVIVEDREVETVVVRMLPKPGVVELKLPGGLEPVVRVNGEDAVFREDGGVEVPANEAVDFELRLANYLTMVRRFDLAPNERVVWKVDPVPIPGPTRGQSWTLPYLGLKFAWIEPGTFTMGSPMPEPGRLPTEGPQTEVRFTRGFWMGVHEVTQKQYSELMPENPSEFRGASNPVDSVVWADAKIYCELLTEFEADAGRLPEGYAYRLPTEAEWEYAARAGTRTPFSFGSRADASMGVFRGVYPPGTNEGLRVPDHYGTLPVGSFAANPWGLFDVHGNVEEWTLDAYNGRLPGGSQTDPRPRGEGRRIAIRGGSWEDFAVRVRSAARDETGPGTESNGLGFRVILAPVFED